MSNRAIYSVIENGKTQYLYGQRAASYSLPFLLLQNIETMKNDPEEEFSTAERMAVLALEPDSVVEILDPERAEATLFEFGSAADVAMHITIDMDNGMIQFEHNPKCYYRQPDDFSIQINDGMTEYIDVKQEIESGAVGFDELLEHNLADRLHTFIRDNSIGKEEHKAIFVISDNGTTRYFGSNHAGTFNGAMTLLSDIERIKDRLGDGHSAGDIASLQLYDYRYGFGFSSEDRNVPINITPQEARELSASPVYPMQVTMDFVDELISIRQRSGDEYSDVCVSFDDAHMCMDWALADVYDELDVASRVDESLAGYIRDYVPHQEPDMQMGQ